MRLFAVLLLFSVSLFAQAHYRHNGAALENDLHFTPGSVRTADVKAICSTRTGTIRNVTQSEKRQVFALYGIDCAKQKCGKWECDHLISLEVGGDNSIQNLWPQTYVQPGARQKDVLENLFHKMICDGRITPKQAQLEISRDWYSAYKRYVRRADVKLPR